MATIIPIDLGAIPNDGAGDPLRVGGQGINTNFQNLNNDKTETGGYAGSSQDLKDLIDGVGAFALPRGGYTGTGLDLFNRTVSYRHAEFLVSQSGTNDPTALEEDKTLDGTLTITRTAKGVYLVTNSLPEFLDDRTGIIAGKTTECSIICKRISDTQIQIDTLLLSNNAHDDDLLNDTLFEIRVYPII